MADLFYMLGFYLYFLLCIVRLRPLLFLTEFFLAALLSPRSPMD